MNAPGKSPLEDSKLTALRSKDVAYPGSRSAPQMSREIQKTTVDMDALMKAPAQQDWKDVSAPTSMNDRYD